MLQKLDVTEMCSYDSQIIIFVGKAHIVKLSWSMQEYNGIGGSTKLQASLKDCNVVSAMHAYYRLALFPGSPSNSHFFVHANVTHEKSKEREIFVCNIHAHEKVRKGEGEPENEANYR